ncbi:MAG: hypothetical protein WDN28_11545 [Chthoniobacter sp.]
MGYSALDDQEAKASKILGEGAKFPPRKVDIGELGKKQIAAFEAFYKARDEMAALLQDCENACDAIANGLKQLSASYEKNDFGLDAKKDAKKIKQAQQLFLAFFVGEEKSMAHSDQTIDELQKHLVQLSKYKSPPVKR